MTTQPKKRSYRPRAPEQMSDRAFVIVELERATGQITVDTEFAMPLEAAAMLERAAQQITARLDWE